MDWVHHAFVFDRRVAVLSGHLAALLPRAATVLDVGCGDGRVARAIRERRPDVEVRGIDVLVRPVTHIPVDAFDGVTIPHGDNTFDVVMFVDVLHHTSDPLVLLAEAARCARRHIVIKDHTENGVLARATLRFMDDTGNARHGVNLPYNYWPRRRWQEAFASLRFEVEAYNGHLGLYPPPATWLFDRSLHFVARLRTSDVPVNGERDPAG